MMNIFNGREKREKMKEKFMKTLKNVMVKRAIFMTVVILVIAIVLGIFFYNDEEEVDNHYLGTQLEKVGELTTVKLTYTGITDYADEGIPIVNKSDFVIKYQAVARVGIRIEDVKTEVDNLKKIVWLTIPKAEIQDVHIDASDITYYDEKFSLLNFDEKEDGNKAIAKAENEAKKDLKKMGVLESADEQSFTLIKGILHNAVPSDYAFKLKEKNRI